ncbi:MAG: V-type ATP synthase subunit E family protein [candidate division WOR-3 bacterium]
MSFDKLKTAIIESARKKAEEIRIQTEEVTKERKKKVGEIINAQITEYEVLINKKVEQLKKQVLSEQTIKNQEKIIKAKWDILNEVFDEACQNFMNSPSYYQILNKLTAKFADSQSVILANERDRSVLQSAFPHIQIYVHQSITGGIIIKKERTELNYTLDLIVTKLKKTIVDNVAKILFSKENS